MANEVHQHPDDVVYVRTDQGVYADTPENLAVDFGAALPSLPEGADDRIYTQGVRHAIMGGGSVVEGGPMPWPLGDQLIASITDLLAKKSLREAAERANRPVTKPPPGIITYSALRARMTVDERMAIMIACQSQPAIQDFVLWAASVPMIDLASADVEGAKAALVGTGLITADRAAVIFAIS